MLVRSSLALFLSHALRGVVRLGFRRAVLFAVVLTTSACERQETTPSPPSLPPKLSVPPNVRLANIWKAEGIQPYLCLLSPNGSALWVRGEPSSVLKDSSGAVIGWQEGWAWIDVAGNRIEGRVAERAEAAGRSAFLIEAGWPNGSATALIRYLQRVVTDPPDVPTAPCDPAHAGTSVTKSFVATDYVYEVIAGLLPGACGDFHQECCVEKAPSPFGPPVKVQYCHIGFECQGTCIPAKPGPPCGEISQSCCRDPDYFDPEYDFCNDYNNSYCATWNGDHGTCVACGKIGQFACGEGRVCHEGIALNRVCVACGEPGQPECPGGGGQGPFTGPVGGGGGSGHGGTNLCAKMNESCAPNGQPGMHCCQEPNALEICVSGKCKAGGPDGGNLCAKIDESCVPDGQPGMHCCQEPNALELCVYKQCKACVQHGMECLPGQTQICCNGKDGDVCKLDQATEKIICDIPG